MKTKEILIIKKYLEKGLKDNNVEEVLHFAVGCFEQLNKDYPNMKFTTGDVLEILNILTKRQDELESK